MFERTLRDQLHFSLAFAVLAIVAIVYLSSSGNPGVKFYSESNASHSEIFLLPGEREAISIEGDAASRERVEAVDTWVFSVVDASTQEPIVGVTCASTLGTRRRLAATDSLGTFKLSKADRVGDLELSAPGYRGRLLNLENATNGCVVELSRAKRVVGRFIDRDGNPAPSGCRVIAFDSTLGHPNWEDVRPGFFHRGNEVDIGVVGLAGRFELNRLAVGVEYAVLGVGPGVLSEYQVLHYDSSLDEVVLLGGELRVARVEFFDKETGDSLRTFPGVRGQDVGVSESFSFNKSKAKAGQISEDVLSLVGFAFGPSLGNSDLETWNLSAFVCFGESEQCLSEVEAILPGYLAVQFQATYEPPSSYQGPTRVGLVPTGTGWADLSVQLRSMQWRTTIKGRGMSVAQLRLIPQTESGGGGTWLDIPIDLFEPTQHFEGIPIGEYSAQLRMLGGFARIGPENDSVLSLTEDGATLSFDLGMLHSTEFAVTNQVMVSHVGKLRGVLVRHREGRTQETPFYFPGPPYAFVGLPPGEYSLMVDPPVMFPRPADPASAGAKFRVGPETAGIVHDLEVVF